LETPRGDMDTVTAGGLSWGGMGFGGCIPQVTQVRGWASNVTVQRSSSMLAARAVAATPVPFAASGAVRTQRQQQQPHLTHLSQMSPQRPTLLPS